MVRRRPITIEEVRVVLSWIAGEQQFTIKPAQWCPAVVRRLRYHILPILAMRRCTVRRGRLSQCLWGPPPLACFRLFVHTHTNITNVRRRRS